MKNVGIMAITNGARGGVENTQTGFEIDPDLAHTTFSGMHVFLFTFIRLHHRLLRFDLNAGSSPMLNWVLPFFLAKLSIGSLLEGTSHKTAKNVEFQGFAGGIRCHV